MSIETFDEYLSAIRSKHQVLSSLVSRGIKSNGTKASISFIWENRTLSGLDVELVFNQITLNDGTQVHLSILCERNTGYTSPPIQSEFYGKNVGQLMLNVMLNYIPTEQLERVNAKRYLANDPTMLCEQIQTILDIQKDTIRYMQDVIGDADSTLANVVTNSSMKNKRLNGSNIERLINTGMFGFLRRIWSTEK